MIFYKSDNRTYVTWEQYIQYLTTIREYSVHTLSQVIIGLTRGGLIPAVILSHALNLPMVPFDPHLLHLDGTEREPIILPISRSVTKRILLVDDIADTGKTFNKCSKFFNNRGFIINTVSVFTNMNKTIFKPNFPGIDSEEKWIIFPYEKDDLGGGDV